MALKLIAIAAVAATLWHRHKNRQDQDRVHQDRQLDEALDESFPASDPPSMTSQRRITEPHL